MLSQNLGKALIYAKKWIGYIFVLAALLYFSLQGKITESRWNVLYKKCFIKTKDENNLYQ